MSKRFVPSPPFLIQPLARELYASPADVVAQALLGHLLLRRTAAGLAGGPIVEVEAYLRGDPACHAANGMTPRNEVMFGIPGRAYVYYIYGAHYCVNAVCLPEGLAEAVLIRAIEPSINPEAMLQLRQVPIQNISNGPGKLCAALDIDRKLNGADLCDPSSDLLIIENPNHAQFLKSAGPIAISTRIGITKAAALPLRFYLKNSHSLSRKHRP